MTSKECCEKCYCEKDFGLKRDTPTEGCSCTCHKEPEAGWVEEFSKLPWIVDGLVNYEMVETFLAKQIDKAREEAGIFWLQHGKNEGRLQALSRIEEHVERKMRVMPDHKCFSEGYCDHYPVTDINNATLTDIKAVITKLREQV